MKFFNNMEKRCQDCKYKVYEQVDTKKVWPFCACKDRELRDITNKLRRELNKYQVQYHIRDDKEMSDDILPSCQLVQSAYDILLNSHCNKYCVE